MRSLLIACAVLLASSEVSGQRCRNNIRVSNYSYGSSYVAPVTSSYYYPSQSTTYYPTQKIIAQEVQVEPLVVTVPVVPLAVPINYYGAQHYYSAQQTYQDRAQLRALLREELQNIMQQQQQPQQQQQATPPMLPLKKEESRLPEHPNVPGEGPDTPPELAAAVIKVFSTNCATCHGPTNANPSGRLNLFTTKPTGESVLPRFSIEKKWMIYGMASTGVMPPQAAKDPAKAVNLDDLNTLLKWAVIK